MIWAGRFHAERDPAVHSLLGFGIRVRFACVSLFVCLFVHGLRKLQKRRRTKGRTYTTRGSRPQGQADAAPFVLV